MFDTSSESEFTRERSESEFLQDASEIGLEEIHEQATIAQGRYGIVRRGTCRGVTVAVKTLSAEHLGNLDKSKLRDIRREIHILTAHHHPHIVTLMGAYTDLGSFKLVLELMDGDLEGLLIKNKDSKKIHLFSRMQMALDAAKGMNWLHCATPAVVHRDLKLANLMYKREGDGYIVKVADFGLSTLIPRGKQYITEDPRGTPLTLAPEIWYGEEFNQKADVYSFALVVWQMYTLAPLFANHTACEYDRCDCEGKCCCKFGDAVCEGGERPPLPDRPDMELLHSMLERCWHEDPDERLNFTEILTVLEKVVVHAAIADNYGRAFWCGHFGTSPIVRWPRHRAEKKKSTDNFMFCVADLEESGSVISPKKKGETHFVECLYAFLGLEVPHDDGSETDDVEVLKLRYLLKTLDTTSPEDNDNNGDSSKYCSIKISWFSQILDWFGPLLSEQQIHNNNQALQKLVEKKLFVKNHYRKNSTGQSVKSKLFSKKKQMKGTTEISESTAHRFVYREKMLQQIQQRHTSRSQEELPVPKEVTHRFVYRRKMHLEQQREEDKEEKEKDKCEESGELVPSSWTDGNKNNETPSSQINQSKNNERIKIGQTQRGDSKGGESSNMTREEGGVRKLLSSENLPVDRNVNSQNFLDRLWAVCSQEWFHGKIKGERKVLLQRKPGTFLVGFCNHVSGDFVLSKVNKSSGIENYKIVKTDDGYTIKGAKEARGEDSSLSRVYEGLVPLIAGVKRDLGLKYPCPGSVYSDHKLANSNTRKRWKNH